VDGEGDLVELRVIARVGEAKSLLCAVGREDLVGVVEEVLQRLSESDCESRKVGFGEHSS
jgi:hypothetical protein